jgi:hypothetical protein
MKKEKIHYSKFYLTFSFVTFLILYAYWKLILSNIFQYFKLNSQVQTTCIVIHFGIFIVTILKIYEYYENKNLDIKFALLFKDLSIINNISYEELLINFPNYHKKDFLKEHKFEVYQIISYLKYKERKEYKFENITWLEERPNKIFKIDCTREKNGTNYIMIYLLNNEDDQYPEYNLLLNYRLLNNYESIEKLIDEFIKRSIIKD